MVLPTSGTGSSRTFKASFGLFKIFIFGAVKKSIFLGGDSSSLANFQTSSKGLRKFD